MPSLNFITCEILLPGDIPLQELGTKYANRAVTTYVPVPEYTIPFTIRVKSDSHVLHPGITALVFIDGIFQASASQFSSRLYPPDINHGYATQHHHPATQAAQRLDLRFDGRVQTLKTRTKSSDVVKRPWRFQKFNIVDQAPNPHPKPSLLPFLGLIEVLLMRCHPEIDWTALPRYYPSPQQHHRFHHPSKASSHIGSQFTINQFDGANTDYSYTDDDFPSSEERYRQRRKHIKSKKRTHRHHDAHRERPRPGSPSTHAHTYSHAPQFQPASTGMPINVPQYANPYESYYFMPGAYPVAPVQQPMQAPYAAYGYAAPIAFNPPPVPPAGQPSAVQQGTEAASEASTDLADRFRTLATAEVNMIKQRLEADKKRKAETKRREERKKKTEMFAEGIKMLREAAERKLNKGKGDSKEKVSEGKKSALDGVFEDKQQMLKFMESLFDSDDNENASDARSNHSRKSADKQDASQEKGQTPVDPANDNGSWQTAGHSNGQAAEGSRGSHKGDVWNTLDNGGAWGSSNKDKDEAKTKDDGNGWGLQSNAGNKDEKDNDDGGWGASAKKSSPPARSSHRCSESESEDEGRHVYYSSHWQPKNWHKDAIATDKRHKMGRANSDDEGTLFNVPRGKVADSVVDQVRTGAPQPAKVPNERIRYIDTVENPFAVFRFKYRRPAVLKEKYKFKVKDLDKDSQRKMLLSLPKAQLVNIVTAMESSKHEASNDDGLGPAAVNDDWSKGGQDDTSQKKKDGRDGWGEAGQNDDNNSGNNNNWGENEQNNDAEGW